MQKFLILFLILAVAAILNSLADIKFKNTIHDFGEIKEEEGPYEYTFEFNNTGNEPFKLTKVKAGWGCTTPSWSTEEIAAGEKGFIKVLYKSNNRPGKFNKKINVNTDIDLQTTILKIKGNVIPTPGKLRSSIGILSASNNLIDFKNIYKEQQDEQTIEIANTRDKEIEILLIDIPEYLSLKVDKQIIAPGERSNIHVLLMADKIKEYGKFQYSPEIELKFADNLYSGSITIRANIREDFSHLSPQELVDAPKIIFPVKSKNIGIISEQSDQFVTFEFHNSGKSELLIHNIQLNNSTFTLIEYSKYIKPEAKGIIKLKLTDNHKNSLNSSFTVISNDPQNSEVIIQIFGSIKKQETGKTDIKNHLENIDLQKAWELIEEYKDSEKLVVLDVRRPD